MYNINQFFSLTSPSPLIRGMMGTVGGAINGLKVVPLAFNQDNWLTVVPRSVAINGVFRGISGLLFDSTGADVVANAAAGYTVASWDLVKSVATTGLQAPTLPDLANNQEKIKRGVQGLLTPRIMVQGVPGNLQLGVPVNEYILDANHIDAFVTDQFITPAKDFLTQSWPKMWQDYLGQLPGLALSRKEKLIVAAYYATPLGDMYNSLPSFSKKAPSPPPICPIPLSPVEFNRCFSESCEDPLNVVWHESGINININPKSSINEPLERVTPRSYSWHQVIWAINCAIVTTYVTSRLLNYAYHTYKKEWPHGTVIGKIKTIGAGVLGSAAAIGGTLVSLQMLA